MSEQNESNKVTVDVFDIMRRRGGLFFATVAVVTLIGVAVAYQSTPLYASRGVLLAELPNINQTAVRSMVQSRPEARVRIITQRVLTKDNVEAIIAKNGLYPELAGMPAEARSRFHQNLDLSAEEPQILESLLGTTRPEGALAFSVKFTDPSPSVAREVADDLVGLYVEENSNARREQAAETIRFLSQEANRLDAEIAAREERLAQFKSENAGALPDLAETNLQMLDRVMRDREVVEQEIRTLRERQMLFSSELAQLSPGATVLNDQGAPVLSPHDRMKMLQREYLQMSSVYNRDHPDVQRVRRELESLAASTGIPAFDRATLESELQAREDELAAARERYSADHPDVVRIERTVEAARQALASAPRVAAARRIPSTPDNPAYIQRESQLRGVTADLQAATARRAELLARYEDLERRLQVTPEVEREYNARSRGLAQLVAQYNDTQAKINDAQIALNLEEDPTSERFTILEQPSMSNSPASPNRFAVLVLTLAIALALGAGVVATAERSDQTVRNVQDVIANLEMPPLVAIPYVETRRDLKQRSRRRLLGAGAVAAWVGVIYLLVVTPV